MGAPSDVTDETVDATPGVRKRRELAGGTTLGKYKLERVLGSGGMGVVWAAQDPDLERAVALKVLLHEDAAPELRSRLLREARAMARLKHPNVLTVYEVDSDGDRDFIAMELVDGASLDGWLATKPPRDQVWHAIIAAGRGLASAHRAGLVHRDFKPHNVLRSNDGRVLVTDFGLARAHVDSAPPGTTDETTVPAHVRGLEETIDATKSKSSLDGNLTQTGALLGTPAYMAPEQYLGAGASPRTDQFAYCVTAWQLIAGERPFGGTTLDELRRAVSSGAANAPGALPRGIRRVLARGLDPDPEKRWPDMDALLDALERAKVRPRRIAQIVAISWLVIVGCVAVSLGASMATRTREASVQPPQPSSSGCDLAPANEIASAWSPAKRDAMVKQFGATLDVKYVTGVFDEWAKDWIADYTRACASPHTPRRLAKLGCLLGERDEVAGLTEMVPNAPKNAFDGAEMGGILPRTQACDGDAPMTLPGTPDDVAEQKKIKALRPRILAARFAPAKAQLAAMPVLIAEAESIGWDPLTAEAHQAFAIAARRAGEQWELLRDHYRIATQIARRAHHYHLEADTAVGLVVGEIDAATDPGDDRPFLELVAQARAAARNAGDDPAFVARLDQIDAMYAMSRGRIDEAIDKFDQARKTDLAARNFATAIRYANDAVDARLQRDRPDDLDAARQLLADTERAVAGAKLVDEKLGPLWGKLGYLAYLRGDLATEHAYADREAPPEAPPDAVTVSGRVVDDANRPVAGARVVAWRGVLAGDAQRVHVRGKFPGAIATSDASGNFTFKAPPGGGIIAEFADRRSRPRALAGEPLVLVLAPTRTVSGTIACDDENVSGVSIAAHYAIDDTTAWELFTPVARVRTYKLAGLPPGDATFKLETALDPNRPDRKLLSGPVRDGASPRWPAGPTLDVIVRGTDRDAAIYVFRGRVAAKTRADLKQLAKSAQQVTVHGALIVGIGDQSPELMKLYRRGDHHGRFLGTQPGTVTVCAAIPEDDARAVCKTLDVPKAAPASVRNGHGVYPAIGVELELPASR